MAKCSFLRDDPQNSYCEPILVIESRILVVKFPCETLKFDHGTGPEPPGSAADHHA